MHQNQVQSIQIEYGLAFPNVPKLDSNMVVKATRLNLLIQMLDVHNIETHVLLYPGKRGSDTPIEPMEAFHSVMKSRFDISLNPPQSAVILETQTESTQDDSLLYF